MQKYLYLIFIVCLLACTKDEFIDAEPREIVALDEQLKITGSENLMTYSCPFIAFNYSIQKEFSLSKNPEAKYRYKVIGVNFSNYNSPYDTLWNETRDTVYFIPKNNLQLSSETNFGITLKLQKKQEELWNDVVDSAWQFNPHHYITRNYARTVNNYLGELTELKFINIESGDTLERYPDPIRIQFGTKVNEAFYMPSLFETLFTELEVFISRDGDDVPYKLEPVRNGYDIVILDPLCKECAYDLNFSISYFREIFGKRIMLESYSGVSVVNYGYRFYGRNTTNQGLAKENIQYAYPAENQYYFLKNEYNKGYLKLKYPQPEVYHADGTDLWDMEVIISNLEGFPVHSSEVAYNHDENYFEYDLDGNLLKNETIYKVEFFESSLKLQQLNLFHTYYFRTSMYDVFHDKFNNILFLNSWFYPVDPFYLIGKNIKIQNEPFDRFEGTQAIRGIPDLKNTPYYKDYVYPLVYSGVDENILIPSVETELGFPKISTDFYSHPSIKLTEENILNNSAERDPTEQDQQSVFEDATYHYAAKHFDNLKRKSRSYYDQENAWIQLLQNSRFPSFTDQDHLYKLQYILPGKELVTSEEAFTWHHPFK